MRLMWPLVKMSWTPLAVHWVWDTRESPPGTPLNWILWIPLPFSCLLSPVFLFQIYSYFCRVDYEKELVEDKRFEILQKTPLFYIPI